MQYLLYLAKPKYGGWVTFSSQLAKINKTHIFKITSKGEKKKRNFGYDIEYQNIPLYQLQNLNKDDRIIITAATPRIPLPLSEQLNENGKLILPLGESFSQVLTLLEKKKGKLEPTDICGCVFVPLVGKYSWPNTEK